MQSNNNNPNNAPSDRTTQNILQQNDQQFAPLMDPPAELLQEANQADLANHEEAKNQMMDLIGGQQNQSTTNNNQEMLNPSAPQFEPVLGQN